VDPKHYWGKGDPLTAAEREREGSDGIAEKSRRETKILDVFVRKGEGRQSSSCGREGLERTVALFSSEGGGEGSDGKGKSIDEEGGSLPF